MVNGNILSKRPSVLEKTSVKAHTVVDCKGKFSLPGLWDMHGHYSKDKGPFYLAGGLTHLLDMGNDKILLICKK